MITATIISILVALASAIWAFIERKAKGILQALIEEMKLDSVVMSKELKSTKFLLEEERALLAQEKRKMETLKATPCECPHTAPMVEKMAVAAPDEFDVTGLVDVTDEFKIGDDERVVFFEFYKDKNAPREIRWRLKAKNNKVLADSGEGYGSKQNLKKALGVMLSAIKKGELKSKWRS